MARNKNNGERKYDKCQNNPTMASPILSVCNQPKCIILIPPPSTQHIYRTYSRRVGTLSPFLFVDDTGQRQQQLRHDLSGEFGELIVWCKSQREE